MTDALRQEVTPFDVGYGYKRLSGGYPVLYQYELSYKGQSRAWRYCIPVMTDKGKLRFYRGSTSDEAEEKYKKDLAKGELNEVTVSLDQARKHLFERRGLAFVEKWEVARLKCLGEFDPYSDMADLVTTGEAAVRELVRRHGK